MFNGGRGKRATPSELHPEAGLQPEPKDLLSCSSPNLLGKRICRIEESSFFATLRMTD